MTGDRRRLIEASDSNTLLADFCVDALEEALSKWGKPVIFNTDQGSQFTSTDFLKSLINNEISVSMERSGVPVQRMRLRQYFH